MSKIVVGGVEKFSAVDFPEKLSAVVFMQGCPWKCPFCHNASIREILSENNFSRIDALWQKGHFHGHPCINTTALNFPGKSTALNFSTPPTTILDIQYFFYSAAIA